MDLKSFVLKTIIKSKGLGIGKECLLTNYCNKLHMYHKWIVGDKNSLVCGEPALLKPVTLKYVYGGTISIVSPGQNKEIKK